jgi:hypothetical protein
MELTEFKKLLHSTMQDSLLSTYHDYMKSVRMSEDPEVQRKALMLHITTIGAEHKEKADSNAGLAVFQFNFHNGHISATQVSPPAADVVDMDEPKPEAPGKLAAPATRETLATLDFFQQNPAARVALNRDVDFEDDNQ